jgi:hypothetical protein
LRLHRLNKQKEFNVNLFSRDSPVGRSFADRTALVMLLTAFGLSDAATVGLAAGVVSGTEVVAGAFSFGLIAFGAIFTAYEMAHLSGRWPGWPFSKQAISIDKVSPIHNGGGS